MPPPPLPAKNASGLRTANNAATSSSGAPGGTVAPCKWKLSIKVNSGERFWAKEAFDVAFGPVKAGPVNRSESPIASSWYTGKVKMAKLVSPEVLFNGSGSKRGGVTAVMSGFKKEAGWELSDAGHYVNASLDNGQHQKVDLHIHHPLQIHLEFKFKDPEKKVFPFPKGYPIQIWGDKQIFEKTTDEKGRLSFELDRKYDWITLKFGNARAYFTVGDGKAGTCQLKTDADRKALVTKGEKFWSPPNNWSLVESMWSFSEQPKFIDGTAAYKEKDGKIHLFEPKQANWVRRIGEAGAPITLTLDPHWTFNRFEYFDRYYGHTDHGHQRVNLPPVLVDAIRDVKGGVQRQGSGHWVLNPTSAADSVHAVPWIRQRTAAGAKAEQPNAKGYVAFVTDENTWSGSTDAATRKIEVIPRNDKRLSLGVDRLKYYDLPKQWKSPGYWTRFGKGAAQKGKFWNDWTEADYRKSRAAASPIIFSLDDVVLSDNNGAPLTLAADNKFAVFYHRFKPDYDEKKNVSDHGVYKPDADEPYFSAVKFAGTKFNYLTEYPNWVRLIAGTASLFDVFDQRTKSDIVGARAGVKWYDPVASGAPAGGLAPFFNAIEQGAFVLEPYYGQQQHRMWQQYNAGHFRLGRFDMVLLRDCDRIGTKELFVNMQYFRLFYSFDAGSTVKGAKQKVYKKDSAVALMNRWNGNDAANASRGELVPHDASKLLTGEVLWFVQPAQGLADAHFKLDIKNNGADARAWMSGEDGTGEVDDTYAKPSRSYETDLAYVLAHELGHGGSLPDEYGEWWTRCSHNGPGITCNIPGDPFVDEGRDFDLTSSLHGAANPPYPMMTMTVEMRNRYFWHNAEFARKFIKQPMYAKHGKYAEYTVPGHPKSPRQNYNYWPIASALNKTLAAKGVGAADLYLHAAGKEHFTVTLMPKGPYDGILSILIKIALYESGNSARMRDLIRNAMLDSNKRYYASGTVEVQTDAGKKDYDSEKSMVRFTPRFLIDEVDKNASNAATYAADFAGFLADFGVHSSIRIENHKGTKGAAVAYDANTSTHTVKLDYSNANAVNDFTTWTETFFREMVGVKAGKNITAAALKAIAQAVFTTNADVQDL